MTSSDRQRDPITGRVITVRKNVVRRDVVRRDNARSTAKASERNCSGSVFALGLDLAQVRDYTAIAIIERVYPTLSNDRVREAVYHVRYLARVDLGTSYCDIVDQVTKLMQPKPLLNATRLVLDRTSVGAPVADMFLHEGLKPLAINITGGQFPSIKGRTHNVPRQYLISVLQNLLQTGRLQIASELEFAPILRRELINFTARKSMADDDESISWRENEHDDLVFALMLACYYFERLA
jgi:hypothetical protein